MTETGGVLRSSADASHAGRSRRGVAIDIALFGVAFAVYLTAFSLTGEPFPKHWVYSTDTTEAGLRIFEDPDRWALYHLKRRPLFVVLSAPVFELGRGIFGGLDAPTGRNLALALGPALAGALAVVVAWRVLRRVCGDSGLAAPALLLYATAGSTLFFSGFPESYAAAALAVNLFLLGLLHWPAEAVVRPAIANALAALVSPPLVLLAVVPGVRYLRPGSRSGFGRVARYAGIVVALYFVPAVLLGGVTPFGFKPSRMGYLQKELHKSVEAERNRGLRSEPAAWAALVANHALYAIVSPPPEITPESHIEVDTHYRAGAIVRAGASYQIVAWPILAIVLCGLVAALRHPPPTLPFARELAVFLIAYLGLIGWANLSEPFLYTMPFLLPLLLLALAPLAQKTRTHGLQAFAWLLAAGSAAANLRLVLLLRTML